MSNSKTRKALVNSETDATPTSIRLTRSRLLASTKTAATTSTAPSEGENLHENRLVKTEEVDLLRKGSDAEEEDDENEERKARSKRKSTGRKKKKDWSSKKKLKKEEPLLSSAVKTEEDGDLSGSSGLCGDEEEEAEEGCVLGAGEKKMFGRGNKNAAQRKNPVCNADDEVSKFVGEPIPEEEARKRWPERYPSKKLSGRSITSTLGGLDGKLFVAKHHYMSAKVDSSTYNLDDDIYVQADPGKPHYIGRIVEFFESTDGELYFTAQWFFRVEDTAIGSVAERHIVHDPRRVFLSEEKNENILDCIVHKINIIQWDPQDKKAVPCCDFYYDMSYSVQYTSFTNLPHEPSPTSSEESSTLSFDDKEDTNKELNPRNKLIKVLDLYAGCGAMSTGLCHGARIAGLDIDTAWAVDINSDACSSLQLNHPNTKVRNENAEDFLKLLKEWEKLCATYGHSSIVASEQTDDDDDLNNDSGDENDEEFVVEKLLDICHGDPSATGNVGIKFKVRWKGYGPDEDTWEPIDSLGNCQECIAHFVKLGMMNNILPLPSDVDVICGGPPCQGISGFNRFRNFASPLEDIKNRQMLTYMEIVDHLKPKYVLMENVVDILKFSGGFLGRYALSFLISRKYQARLGIMAAGCYGLPQFRLRVFLWGAHVSEKLPQFPLPTHDVVVRSGIPNEFEQNLVGYNEGEPRNLKKALLLEDAISDLPPVSNFEDRDEMPYDQPPKTEFQRLIRTPEHEFVSISSKHKDTTKEYKLFDHRPLKLNTDDYQRVQQIPKHKGANFRNLSGVRVDLNNVVELDPSIERVLLPSGKPLIPDYAISFLKGKSLKPFARLWWDETVATVVTRAEPHNQKIIHPLQDRVLTVRENARLQGFPDYYQLRGSIKERYIQVGNAVAFPVSRALGYSLGLAYTKCVSDNDSQLKLPFDFPLSQ